jgi:hypothetical protein
VAPRTTHFVGAKARDLQTSFVAKRPSRQMLAPVEEMSFGLLVSRESCDQMPMRFPSRVCIDHSEKVFAFECGIASPGEQVVAPCSRLLLLRLQRKVDGAQDQGNGQRCFRLMETSASGAPYSRGSVPDLRCITDNQFASGDSLKETSRAGILAFRMKPNATATPMIPTQIMTKSVVFLISNFR